MWHPALLGKLCVNMNFRQFMDVICAKNLRESDSKFPRVEPWHVLNVLINLNVLYHIITKAHVKFHPNELKIFREKMKNRNKA